MKKKTSRAYSLVELMVTLIIISIFAAVFMPVLTKKMKASKSESYYGQVTSNCNQSNSDGSYSFGQYCAYCEKTKCLICSITCNGKTKNETKCTCE